MKISNFTPILALALSIFSTLRTTAQTLLETDINKFKVSGYMRSGFGYSEDGSTQAHFQMPGALNKYSLGNQADTYGELEFDYTHYLDGDKTRSIDAVWMVSMYEDYGTENQMSFNFTEQLYLRVNNLLGFNESIWFGNRFYDRSAIHMLDRQWMNPGQKGWGGGIENFLNKSSEEDLKIAAWQLKDRDVTSYKNGLIGELTTYTADIRWVHKPIAENSNINLALNYSRRVANDELGYKAYNGYGAFAWVDYSKRNITNTTALLFRQGANVSIDHWSGMSQKENPGNDNLVLNDLNGAYSFELNNNFLYDDLDRFSINAIFMFVARNYGTDPYLYENDEKVYLLDRGNMFYWLSAGTRAMYYVSKHFRPTVEYTYEYGDNTQLGVKGSLHKITITPELSLAKGFYSRPVLRPFATYAFWSDDLKGYIGGTPNGAPFADKTSGFTYGLQFEIWW
ncbi:MAG: carbohydrate porin [Rikenellaceae bacterium]